MDVLSSSQIEYISSLSAVEAARSQILSKTSGMVYFTVELPDEIKTLLLDTMGLDLSHVSKVPMRWVKGDTVPHVDRGDTFDNTYLVYLTDSSGELILGDTHYPIARGRGYVFNEGLSHSTVGTGNEPRLLLGPMSENGVPVGIFTIEGSGGTNIYIRQSGEDIEYSQDEQETWSAIFRPCLITNTDTPAGMLKVLFTTDLSLTDAYWYFVCGSDSIQFGSESLNSDGTRPVLTVTGVEDYPGLINNGNDGGNGHNSIKVYNLDVRSVDSTLAVGGGWIGQAYYGNNASNNYVINCCSNGDISENGGGIMGQLTGYQGYINIIGCSSSGDQAADNSGGIVGYHASLTGGQMTIASCFSTGDISGTGCGGIIGKNAGDNCGITVTDCYSTGEIGGSGCGGIAGSYCGVNSGELTVRNCYTTGSITSSDGGGIIGSNCENCTITNCYTTGNIDSEADAGGIVGSGSSGGSNR